MSATHATVIEWRCPKCGHFCGGEHETPAWIALRNAGLTEEQDQEIAQFVEFLVWKKRQAQKRSKKP